MKGKFLLWTSLATICDPLRCNSPPRQQKATHLRGMSFIIRGPGPVASTAASFALRMLK